MSSAKRTLLPLSLPTWLGFGASRARRRAANQLLLVVALLLAGIAGLRGASLYGQTTPDPQWQHFTQDGSALPSNSVRSILAGDGVLWFGSDNGITRFDGGWNTFLSTADADLILPGEAPAGSTVTLATGLVTTTVWAGTDEGVLAFWDGEQWSHRARFNTTIRSIHESPDVLWVGTDDGLYTYDASGQMLVDALGRQPVYALVWADDILWAGAQDGLWRHSADRWARVSTSERFFSSGVYSLLIDSKGYLWTGSPYGVAYRALDTGVWTLVETLDEDSNPALVRDLAEDHSGAIWAATDGAGAFSYVRETGRLTQYGQLGDTRLTTRFIRSVEVDFDGSVWYATPVGAFRYQTKLWRHDLQGRGIDDPLNYVNDLMVDRDGALWVATGGGGLRYKPGLDVAETVYGPDDGLSDVILVVEQDASGSIWAGTFSGAFRYVDGRWITPIPVEELGSETVTTLLADGQHMWLGTEAGLYRFDLDANVGEPIPDLEGQIVEATTLDSLGRLWVGTQTSGIWRLDENGNWLNFRHSPRDSKSLPRDTIIGSGLVADPHVEGSVIALVAQEGIVRWTGNGWEEIDMAELPSNLVWTLYADPETDDIWIGSEAGVTRYDGRTWGSFDARDGLQSSVVYAIARTPDGGYWFGGRTGLSYYHPETTPPWVRVTDISGEAIRAEDGSFEIGLAQDLLIHIEAGDLQTSQNRLKILTRIRAHGEEGAWRDVPGELLPLRFDAPGDYLVELIVRDEAFNYSPPVQLSVKAAAPPPVVALPYVGDVGQGVFRLLLAFAVLAVGGSSYVLFEFVRNRRSINEAINRGFNPYISGDPIRGDEMFFGRRDLVQRIVDTLHNNSIMIHGERRIGKTTLLYQLYNTLREVDDPEYWFVPVFIDLEGTEQALFFHYLMDEILHTVELLPHAQTDIIPDLGILIHAAAGLTDYTDRDFTRDLRRIADVVTAYAEKYHDGRRLRIILLLDEMDVVSGYDHLVQQQLRRIFMRDFAAILGAVVAGIRINKDWERIESPWYNLFNEIALEPFGREQGVQLLTEPVKNYYSFEPEAIDFILENSRGRPFRIQQYGLEAVAVMRRHGRRRVTLADARVAHQQIENGANGGARGDAHGGAHGPNGSDPGSGNHGNGPAPDGNGTPSGARPDRDSVDTANRAAA